MTEPSVETTVAIPGLSNSTFTVLAYRTLTDTICLDHVSKHEGR